MRRLTVHLITMLMAITFGLISSPALGQADDEKTIQAKASFNAGLEAIKKSDTVQAIALYEGAIGLDTTLSDAYLNLGSIQFARGEYDNAAKNFRRLTVIAPNDPVGYMNLGKVLAAQKKDAEAVATYEKVITVAPNHFEAYKEMGKIYYNTESYDKAVSSLEKYIASDTNDYYSFYLLGAASKRGKNLPKATEYYVKALSVNPNHFESCRDLAGIHQDRGQFTEAIKYFEEALRIKPKDYKTAYNLAVAVQSRDPEDYAAAIAAWEKFLALGRKMPKAETYVTRAEEVVKQLKEAQATKP